MSHADLMEWTGQAFDVVLYELDTLNARGSEAAWRLPEATP